MQPMVSFIQHEPTQQTFAAGEIIFRQGDDGDVMYCVITGKVEVTIADEIVEVVEEGGMLGEMALIDNSPRSATVKAKTDCTLAVINQKRFMTLIQQTPYFAIQVMSVLADRLRRCDVRHGGM